MQLIRFAKVGKTTKQSCNCSGKAMPVHPQLPKKVLKTETLVYSSLQPMSFQRTLSQLPSMSELQAEVALMHTGT
jgi:hypothetical protein